MAQSHPSPTAPTPPDVTVVVSTRDRAGRLERLLAALRAQTLGVERFEVVIVDNGSIDRTPAVLARAVAAGDLALRTLRRPRGGGPGHGREAGWRAARAPLVAFTDDDCEPWPGWLDALVQAAATWPACVLAGRTDPSPAERHLLSPFARTQTVHAAGPWYPTCNLALPRALLERLGGFDLAYGGVGGEDTDLAWRALDAGAGARYVPDAGVHHAVEDPGALGALRLALRWSDAMRVFARHPGRRREVLLWGVFWRRAHRDLLLAALGLAAARRAAVLALLALPWLMGARRRLFLSHGAMRHLPWLALHDVVDVYAAVRGALRHRVLVL